MRSAVARALAMTALLLPVAARAQGGRPWMPGDRILMCSDGLHAFVSDAKIREFLGWMPERIDSLELLQELLTTIIWTCGSLHSMLNFSQWDYINLPNMSYAIYAEVPEEVGATTYDTLIRMMPSFGEASYQLWWCKILTSYRYDKLGDYIRQFSSPEAQLTVQMFQQRLQVIEKEIDARDATRRVSFPYLKPSLCINSINT